MLHVRHLDALSSGRLCQLEKPGSQPDETGSFILVDTVSNPCVEAAQRSSTRESDGRRASFEVLEHPNVADWDRHP